eukprot:CAMPEP_0119051122 /NCGR_PEP_ID=MMETSP1177-20130426/72846_1 /TAXON_ID=2985 /ORGANISM="Ochromonas sp, Strain CCMP1899" /LENGTH=760 /DNA_ID=CAMNT_0007030225 /DNA_START=123 /DNA_END=2405 /DNA_ORIENTATION=+
MKWTGEGLTQDDLMEKDQCILVDENDSVLKFLNKKQSHQFTKKDPRGELHRAFSVFVFNNNNELLIQQRAKDKITFPSVWTNSCCSHPLSGQFPSEIDDENAVADGSVPGVKAAAIRKLLHELGIDPNQVPISQFKFLTRLHYWAADVVTHGPESEWGEHEIDYILFIKADVKLLPNKEEVEDTQYVNLSQLQKMMDKNSGMLWSPWFRIIVEKFLIHWWQDLDRTLNTNDFIDYKTIYRFDPSTEHMGGRGHAQAWLGQTNYVPPSTSSALVGDQGSKQGAYGKVKIHKHSKFSQLSRLDEIFAGLWFKYGAVMPNKVDVKDEDTRFCDEILGKVSRSFAAVIRQLPKGLCLDILIFYLALRALDTIEDDMEAFKGTEAVKLDHLNNFYRYLSTDGWHMEGVGAGDERVLLEQFPRFVTVFKGLSPASQEVISDITKRMGQGMASYVDKDLGQGTVSTKDYDLYCHYVAGLVGEGLSRLFTCTGYEQPEVAEVSTTLANTMGLLLQKTNIIRDYLEDYVDGRAFWPQEVWKKYTTTGDLGELAKPEARGRAVACLNEMITDALECVPECMQYMTMLKTEEVFRFCAIPQVMAIATLADLYDNPKVFTGVVKIRKGMAAQLILDTKTTGGLHKWFNILAKDILRRVKRSDPTAIKTRKICNIIIKITDNQGQAAIMDSYAQIVNTICPVVIAITSYHLFWNNCLHLVEGQSAKRFSMALPVLLQPVDYIAAIFFFGAIAFILGYSIAMSGTKRKLRRADP